MGDKVASMIWCGGCLRQNWAEVHAWAAEGKALVRGGWLKRPVRCGGCDAELEPGERVETVTFHSGLVDAAAWAAEYVLFGSAEEFEELEEG
jgi:hypothetical protein